MDIRTRVLANRAMDEMRAARDIDGLAAALNAEGATVIQQRFVTARVVRTLPNGKDILAALKGARAADDDIDLAYTFLMQGVGIDIGDLTTLALIDGLVTVGVFQPSWADQLKTLAMAPLVVSRLDVNNALFNEDGTEKS